LKLSFLQKLSEWSIGLSISQAERALYVEDTGRYNSHVIKLKYYFEDLLREKDCASKYSQELRVIMTGNPGIYSI